MLQNLRIGLRKRRNGKSDVPVKQRGDIAVAAATSVSVTGDWESPSNGIYQTNVLSVAGRNTLLTTNGEHCKESSMSCCPVSAKFDSTEGGLLFDAHRNRFAAELCRPQRRSLQAHHAAQSLEVNRSMSVVAWKRVPRELIMASMVVSLHVARCAHHFGTCPLQLIG